MKKSSRPGWRNDRTRREIQAGYRSGLEKKVAAQLEAAGVQAAYESTRIPYSLPMSRHTYTPDFILPNGIIIETKGRFLAADREKHRLIRDQHPRLDIRFVFSSLRAKIAPGSKTTVAEWCDKYGFQYAEKAVPEEWLS